MTRSLICAAFAVSACLGGEQWLVDPGPDLRLRLVNPNPFELPVELAFTDEDGAVLSLQTIDLAPMQALWFEPEVSGIHAVRVRSVGSVAVSCIHEQGPTWIARRAREIVNTSQLIPHIAEDTAYWNTRLQLATHGLTPIEISAGGHLIKQPITTLNQSLSIDLESLFEGGIPAGAGWASLTSDSSETVATLDFSTQNGRQAAALPLPFESSNSLILPHVPSDRATWWAGLAILNGHDEDLRLSARLYRGGELIETRTGVIAAQTKRVALLDAFFDAPLPTDVDWIAFNADNPFVGFELFGTNNGETLTGLPLRDNLSKRDIYSMTAPRDHWSGLAILNPGGAGVQANLVIRDDAGEILVAEQLQLGPFEKQTLLPEATYGLRSDTYWLDLSCDHGLQTFQLMGDNAQTKLATMLPTPGTRSEIDLALPSPVIDSQETLTDAAFDISDVDGDGEDEMALLSADQLIISDWSAGALTNSSTPFADFSYENQTSVPPHLSIKDLNGDGHAEIMITTRDLTFTTLDAQYAVSRFQNKQLDVAEDPIIRDYADVNNDGFLDILMNRALFKSQLGLSDYYARNTFPFMFQTTGLGSLYLDLNDDPFTDILTVLFDSFYAVLIEDLDSDPDPIYTPAPNRDIIALNRHDFDGDGRVDIAGWLAETGNAGSADQVDIATFNDQGAEPLGQFDVPLEWGLRELEKVDDPTRGGTLFAQDGLNLSRYWDIDLDQGVQLDSARAFSGRLGDFNGDGNIDQIAPNGVILGEYSGRCSSPALAMLNRTYSSDEMIPFQGDYDGDQKLDVLTFRHPIGSTFYDIALWQSAGDGRAWRQRPLLRASVNVLGYAELLDQDGDGDLDLVVAGSGLQMFEQIDGTFQDQAIYLQTPDVFALRYGIPVDLDGNGQRGFIAEHISGSRQLLWVRDAFGPTPSVTMLDIFTDLADVELIDIDRDGDMDLALHSQTRERVLYRNDGGSFSKREFGFAVDAYTLADINADGNLDAFVFVTSPDQKVQYLRYLRNRGDMTFSGSFTFRLPPDTFYTQLLTFDFNRDGRPDVLGFADSDESASVQHLDLWENHYTPALEEQPFVRVRRIARRNEPSRVVKRDFDLDGIPDLQLWIDYSFLWYRARTSYHPDFGPNPFLWPIPDEESTTDE